MVATQDGNTSNWSGSELYDILAIWRGVAEDFAPFDVDVTTEEPTDPNWIKHGARVAVGGSPSDCKSA
jgi:hypothetical protein